MSLPARGAWVETRSTRNRMAQCSRSPQGERGLKPTRATGGTTPSSRRSPQGERGLKLADRRPHQRQRPRRSPQGERGLKRQLGGDLQARRQSLPARGAWVETSPDQVARAMRSRSPQGERGLKPFVVPTVLPDYTSRSPQGERGLKRGNRAKNPRGLVAPRKGSVG